MDHDEFDWTGELLGNAEQPPTYEQIRARALRLLGEVEGVLHSDWLSGTGPTEAQADELLETRRAVAAAKESLDRAGA